MYTTRRRPIGLGVEFPDSTPTVVPTNSFSVVVPGGNVASVPVTSASIAPTPPPGSGSGMTDPNAPSSGGTFNQLAAWWNQKSLALRAGIAFSGILLICGIAYLSTRHKTQPSPRTAVANKRRRYRRRLAVGI